MTDNKIWGFYDDENDDTQDFIMNYEKRILPDNLADCKYGIVESSIENRNKDIRKIRKEIGYDKTMFIIQKPNSDRVRIQYETDNITGCRDEKTEFLIKNVDNLVDYIKKTKPDDNIISGFGVYIARNWKTTSQFPRKFGTKGRGFKFPKALPEYFPKELAVMAYDASKRQLENINNETKQWANIAQRKDALRKQMRLFNI
jgi:hypothetical protein